MNPEDVKSTGNSVDRVRVKCYDGRIFIVYHMITVKGSPKSLHDDEGNYLCSMTDVEYVESESGEWVK